jgi:hypothetical protein
MACAAHENPCTTRAFIADYFGLAMSAGNIYALMVSTHYASSVRGGGGATIYYQEHVLATVPRGAFGSDCWWVLSDPGGAGQRRPDRLM